MIEKSYFISSKITVYLFAIISPILINLVLYDLASAEPDNTLNVRSSIVEVVDDGALTTVNIDLLIESFNNLPTSNISINNVKAHCNICINNFEPVYVGELDFDNKKIVRVSFSLLNYLIADFQREKAVKWEMNFTDSQGYEMTEIIRENSFNVPFIQ